MANSVLICCLGVDGVSQEPWWMRFSPMWLPPPSPTPRSERITVTLGFQTIYFKALSLISTAPPFSSPAPRSPPLDSELLIALTSHMSLVLA